MSIQASLEQLSTRDVFAIVLTAVVIILLVPMIVRFIKDMQLGWRYGLRCPNCGKRAKTSMAHWDDKIGWTCQRGNLSKQKGD